MIRFFKRKRGCGSSNSNNTERAGYKLKDLFLSLSTITKVKFKDIGRLPVVSRDNPQKLLGLVTRKSIISAYNQAIKGGLNNIRGD